MFSAKTRVPLLLDVTLLDNSGFLPRRREVSIRKAPSPLQFPDQPDLGTFLPTYSQPSSPALSKRQITESTSRYFSLCSHNSLTSSPTLHLPSPLHHSGTHVPSWLVPISLLSTSIPLRFIGQTPSLLNPRESSFDKMPQNKTRVGPENPPPTERLPGGRAEERCPCCLSEKSLVVRS